MEPILWDMMQEDEITYLNEYHARVRQELTPLLSGEDLDWLVKATEKHII